MMDFWRNLRYVMQRLLKSPGFTVVSVLTLTLGIGATTAIYTVVQNVLLEPLPYPQAERIVLVQEKNPEAGFPRFSLSPLNFRDYRALSSSFEAMAAQNGRSLALTGEGGGPARRLSGRAVTSDFLRVFGVATLHGRDFTPEDDQPGAPPVVILSQQIWQELGAGEDLLGRDLRLDGRPTTIVGVLPPGLFPGTDVLVPAALDYENISRGAHFLLGYARLNEGVSVDEARRELEAVAANLAAEYPDSNSGWGAIVDPYKERIVENIRPPTSSPDSTPTPSGSPASRCPTLRTTTAPSEPSSGSAWWRRPRPCPGSATLRPSCQCPFPAATTCSSSTWRASRSRRPTRSSTPISAS